MNNEPTDKEQYIHIRYGMPTEKDGRKQVPAHILRFNGEEIAKHMIDAGPVPPKFSMWRRLFFWFWHASYKRATWIFIVLLAVIAIVYIIGLIVIAS